ncbi:right-handed parallel beta-helix repeat-containing protein [Marilutibacter maris]|uniref:right-handed parallel beta-helix repeat-containing protein n=1 Tax=Marilutibacter maris TaxID=1605891 RepID=UPI0011AEA164|nr:right-handed parallel beta-helix repeat-containing protein [Lysobacter maris]
MAKDDVRRNRFGMFRKPRVAWLLGAALIAPVFMAAAQLAEPDVILYPLPQTVYGSEITLTGIARPGQAVVVEVNGAAVARTRANESGDFAVVAELDRGANILRLDMPEARFATASDEHLIRYVSSHLPAPAEPVMKAQAASVSGASEVQPMVAPSPPALDGIPATTTDNPITISGAAAANSEVRFFVNGRYTRSVTADVNGAFSTWVPLEDDANAIYATATDAGGTSATSNTVETGYTNTLVRTQTGLISQDTVWTKGDGSAYSLTGNLTVAPGTTLWIQPGAAVTVAGNYKLIAQGHLVVAGSVTALATFKATASACNGSTRRSDWLGIEVLAGGLADLEYAEVQCANTGVNFEGGTGSVSHSRIVNNTRGVRTQGADPSSIIAPVITAENEFSNNTIGALVRPNSATIVSANNLFSANADAIYLSGGAGASQMQDPEPVITGNQILLSNTRGISTDSFKVGPPATVNATGNWWETTNHSTIAAKIVDWHDASNLDSSDMPIVDFSGYLDGPNGAPFFAGQTLLGRITTDQTLQGEEVQTFGSIIVDPGVTLSIDAGTHLTAAEGSRILVRGALSITGTSNSRVVFRPTTPACDGVARDRSDWFGIEVVPGATAAVNYAEFHCADIALFLNGGTGEVHNSRFLNNDRGIRTQAAASARITPSITTGNEFRGNAYGVVAYINSSPTITGGNLFIDNRYALYVYGNSSSAQNPSPVVTGNSIEGSRTQSFYTSSFGDASNARIDATGNWWGTTDPTAISANMIRDWSDNTSTQPVVDYSGYLDAAGGTAAWTGPTLNGRISANQTLAVTEHLMLGRVEVDTGVSVQVPAGTRVTPVADLPFVVRGTLNVSGTAQSRVVFKPLAVACDASARDRNDWGGVLYQTGSSGSVDHADIHCAENGLYVPISIAITNSRFLSNLTGVNVKGASTSSIAAPTIQSNEMVNNRYGVYVGTDSAPVINAGNLIKGNDRGIYVYGSSSLIRQPNVTINANAIHGNADYSIYAANFSGNSSHVLNATGNWWGTLDPTRISQSIYDRKNSSAAPYVDFSGYLDGPGGSAVFNGSSLLGLIDADQTLGAGEYEVLGHTTVTAGATLTIDPGAEIRFVPGRGLFVDGTLNAGGTPAQRIVFGSAERIRQRGDWYGVVVRAGGVMNVEHARIEHSTYGFDFAGGQGTVQESLIRFNTQGITVESKSSPTISSNNEITSNDYGIAVIGNQSGTANNPLPVTTGNNIYANGTNYSARGFSSPSTVTLDATGNWWQVTDPADIRATIYTGASSSPSVDIGTPLTAATGPLAINVTGVATTVRQIQPLDPASSAQGVFTISRGGTVKTEIRRQSDYGLVYQYEQSFADPGQYGFSWNGRDAGGAMVEPGMYRAVLIADDGRDSMRADFQAQSGVAITTGSAPSMYRPYRNEFYKGSITLAQPGLISMQVTPVGGSPFYAWENIYYPAGTHWVYWDGRDPEGHVIDSEVEILTTDSTYVAANAIQVLAARPEITGIQPAPNIEVKADPYLVTHSYEQITRMAYRLSDDAFVRFVLLPPGDTDIHGPSAVVLLDNALQAAADGTGTPNDHVIEWRGYDPAQPSQIQVAPEGAYTFAIEARSANSGQSTVYRGVVNLHQ